MDLSTRHAQHRRDTAHRRVVALTTMATVATVVATTSTAGVLAATHSHTREQGASQRAGVTAREQSDDSDDQARTSLFSGSSGTQVQRATTSNGGPSTTLHSTGS